MSAAIVSLIIFFITFVIILSEKIQRSVIALFGAVIMVIVGNYMGFYSFDQVLTSIDFNTILLLSGMMIIVAVLEKTGFFQYIAIKTAKYTGGDLWKLTVYLGTLTTVLSMFLDNVTTIILIVPVTLIITKLLKHNPMPILLSEAILSNIGGVATLVGDPPNIIIGSAAGFGFNMFLTHSFPVVIIAWFLTLMYLKFAFRHEFKKAAKNKHTLKKIDADECIKDMKTLRKTLGVLVLVVILFFFHNKLHMPPAMVAIFGASLLLLLVSTHKSPLYILKKIEWHVILFFASLFILVGGLEHSGVLGHCASMILDNANQNILLTAIIVLWVSAILSAIIDNIPMTVAMIPVIGVLEAKGVAGVNLIWWALVFGVGFGGTATPIGSTSGVIVTAKSQSSRHPISTKEWMQTGFPSTIIALLVATYMLIVLWEYYKI